MYYAYQTRQAMRYQRASRRIQLQQIQPVYVIARGSELSLAAPLYEGHNKDQRVPLGVKIEQRGTYLHAVKENDNEAAVYEYVQARKLSMESKWHCTPLKIHHML
jgi:hypothetical protein